MILFSNFVKKLCPLWYQFKSWAHSIYLDSGIDRSGTRTNGPLKSFIEKRYDRKFTSYINYFSWRRDHVALFKWIERAFRAEEDLIGWLVFCLPMLKMHVSFRDGIAFFQPEMHNKAQLPGQFTAKYWPKHRRVKRSASLRMRSLPWKGRM